MGVALKPKITVSFSGGRTSAYMARWLQLNKPDHEIQYVFANTGCEHERTLEFVHECARRWGMQIWWVEAKVNPEKGKGTRHTVVWPGAASLNGEPFEAVIAKYGIPNQASPNRCTRELKGAPLESFRKASGFGDAKIAIGIRADEFDRMSVNAEKLNLYYPLVSEHPVTRGDVLAWWKEQPFDLDLPEIYGNCTWCWKKTIRKHLTLMQQSPRVYDFPERMEREYAWAGESPKVTGKPQRFFRRNLTVADLREMAQKPFEPWNEAHIQPTLTGLLDPLDETNGCEESCEVY